jgi:acyl-[acyl-carrier-protein]-phospholipid O-acyltransferase / long-chain-fatty-acid--[acyl-carrier-protein] ligase
MPRPSRDTSSVPLLVPDDDGVGGLDDAGRVGVLSLSFLALVATQFFVSLNDSVFRWLIVPVAKELLPGSWANMPAWVQRCTNPDTLALSLGLACFTLPFLLLAAPAGYLADRFSKRNVMVGCKAAELVIIGLGVVAILIGNVPMMYLMLFILGAQAMVFVTSKMGAIPEIVRRDKISEANGMINMGSTAAIVLGSIAGGCLYDMTRPAGQGRWWLHASVLLSVALCGFLSSLLVGRLPAANPARKIPWNPASQTVHDMGSLFAKKPLFLAAAGDAYFWSLAALLQINIDQFATKHLQVGQTYVGPLLGVLALGIGGGALLAGFLSHGRVELGLVPFGALGFAGTSLLLAVAPAGIAGEFSVPSYSIGCILLLGLGVTAGFYDIPLQSFVQDRSPPESRGSIMAANNVLAFSGMLSASGIYWFLSGPLGLSSRGVFLVCGLAMLPIAFTALRLLPFQTARFATWALTRCLYRVKIEGLQNIPHEGALVVSNHVSWADGVLLGLACPRHPRIIAFAQYFQNPWLGWFGRLGRIIPLGTTRKSIVQSIRLARKSLRQGELVCVFPEGGITRNGELQEFQPGFLSLLKETEASVVPVYLDGLWGSIFSYERGKFFWKRPKRWPYPVVIRFGAPIRNPRDVDQVRRAVAALGADTGTASQIQS